MKTITPKINLTPDEFNELMWLTAIKVHRGKMICSRSLSLIGKGLLTPTPKMADLLVDKDFMKMEANITPNVNLTRIEFLELMNLTADAIGNIGETSQSDEYVERLFEVAQLTLGIYTRSPRQHELVEKGCTPCVEQAGSQESSSEPQSPPSPDGQPSPTCSQPSTTDAAEIPPVHVTPIVPESPKVIVPGSQAELAQLQQAERAKQAEQDQAGSSAEDDDTNP